MCSHDGPHACSHRVIDLMCAAMMDGLPRPLSSYQGKVMELCSDRRGDLIEQVAAGEGRMMLRYVLPLAELATDLYSEIKSRTQGCACDVLLE